MGDPNGPFLVGLVGVVMLVSGFHVRLSGRQQSEGSTQRNQNAQQTLDAVADVHLRYRLVGADLLETLQGVGMRDANNVPRRARLAKVLKFAGLLIVAISASVLAEIFSWAPEDRARFGVQAPLISALSGLCIMAKGFSLLEVTTMARVFFLGAGCAVAVLGASLA